MRVCHVSCNGTGTDTGAAAILEIGALPVVPDLQWPVTDPDRVTEAMEEAEVVAMGIEGGIEAVGTTVGTVGEAGGMEGGMGDVRLLAVATLHPDADGEKLHALTGNLTVLDKHILFRVESSMKGMPKPQNCCWIV